MGNAVEVRYALCCPIDPWLWEGMCDVRVEAIDKPRGWDFGEVPSVWDVGDAAHVIAYIDKGRRPGRLKVVGCGRVGSPVLECHADEPGVREIGRMAVVEELQGKKDLQVGTNILQRLIAYSVGFEGATKLRLDAVPTPSGQLNEPLIHFYEKHGFHTTGAQTNCDGLPLTEMVRETRQGENTAW